MTNAHNSFFKLLYKEQENEVGFFSLGKTSQTNQRIPLPSKEQFSKSHVRGCKITGGINYAGLLTRVKAETSQIQNKQNSSDKGYIFCEPPHYRMLSVCRLDMSSNGVWANIAKEIY